MARLIVIYMSTIDRTKHIRPSVFVYSPSALLLGFTAAGRPLHFQAASVDSDMTKIITIYEPDPNEWVEFRKRDSHV